MHSLVSVKDSFKKVIITGDMTKRHIAENGIEIISIYDFLLNNINLIE